MLNGFLWITFGFGLIIGSFFNVVIYRLPRKESVVFPPSHCPDCGHRLGFLDLFPILSFLCLRGRCRYCGTKISPRYPLVELATGLITMICWLRFGPTPMGFSMLVLSYVFIPIAYIDLEHKIIPNILTLPLIALGLIFRLWQGEFWDGFFGVLVGGGTLGLIAILYPQGMGWGDVKLMAAAGAFLNWMKCCYIIFLGSFLGLIIMIPLILLKKAEKKQTFPFGPFLVFAALIVIYWPYSL